MTAITDGRSCFARGVVPQEAGKRRQARGCAALLAAARRGADARTARAEETRSCGWKGLVTRLTAFDAPAPDAAAGPSRDSFGGQRKVKKKKG